MKLELDISLEGIAEDYDGQEYSYSIEEHLRHDIISKVIEKLFTAVKDDYRTDIDKIISERIEKLTEETFNTFIDKEIKVTDDYGSLKWTGTIHDLIKEKFDEWLLGTVDKQGRSSDSRYEILQSRVNFIIDERLKKHSEQFVQRAVTEVSDKLEETLSEDLRDMIGKRIADKIGLNKIMPKMIKKK